MDENPVERLQHEDSENLLTPKEESDPESRDLALHSAVEREADQMSVEDDQLPIQGNLTNDSLLLRPLDLSLGSPEGSRSRSRSGSGSGSESESGSASASASESGSESESESDMEDIITEAYDNIEQNYDDEFVEIDNSNVTSMAHSPDMRHATQREFERQESEQLEYEQQGSEQQENEQQENEQQENEQQEYEQQECQQEDIVPSPVADDTTPGPIDQPYCNSRRLSLDMTEEDLIKRNEKLFETDTFFTREAYEAYTMYPPVVVDAEVEHIIRLAEQRHNKRPSDQLIDEEQRLQKVEYTEEDAEQPYEHAESICELRRQPELISPAEIVPKIEPIDEAVPPLVAETKTRKKQKTAGPTGPTVLDTVLTDMLRYNRSQVTVSEPSDLEIAAMAAGLDTSNQPSVTTCSKFTKEDHVRFLRISEALKTGSTNLSESDMEMYKQMCTEIKREQDNFIKEQRKQISESGVYDVLDEKVEKMVQEYCENENKRLLQYPQFYKYFNLLQMPAPNSVADSSVLSFKHSLLQTVK
ncbi:hypothetical protein EDC94DRAFT_411162 [Helicostylum pulchrum]|nr:hypothetical protein EDC94DRAFT_411162 [Helicostylum pulchrum]